MGREKGDLRPVLLKFGLALALTFGGMLYSFIRNKKGKSSQSPTDPSKSSDCGNQVNPGRGSWASKSDHHVTHTSSCQFDSLAIDKHEDLHNSHNSVPDHSPSKKSNAADKDAYLLPEFNDLLKDFDLTSMKPNSSPKKDPELPTSDTESRTHEQEVKSLRNLVKILKERERSLEIQLLEYYGLKEQETAVMELQNRLRLNNMEAKLFAIKIESLQADNRRLVAQMSDYTKVVAELETARMKVKVLKKKLRAEAAENKEQISDLQQCVEKMREDEHKGAVGINPEVELKLCKLKDLEAEVEVLRKSNYGLQLEKSDLEKKLECLQILATSVLEDEETEKLKEERTHLRKENDDFSKEIERLQADRCADVEELVYLRWINACLRYELRNYQPGPGKTIARDLSKTLSPKSEEKAKQLILEYANKEGGSEKGINISEIDSDQWSSSQASNTDYGECDESLIEDSSPRKSQSKFFGKLMKLLRGKDGQQHCRRHHHRHRHRHGSRSWSLDDVNSCSDSSMGHQRLGTPSACSSKHSVDSQKSNHRLSDVGGSVCIYKHIDSTAGGGGSGGGGGGGLISPSLSEGRKSELVKYAEALKDSHSHARPLRLPRRPASYRSF